MGGERVRDRLGSESLWHLIASDSAAILDRSFSDGAISVASVDSANHTSSDDRFLSFKILEQILGVFRNEGRSTDTLIQDGRKSTSHRILEWIFSSILVDLLERIVLFTYSSAASSCCTEFRDCDLVISAD